MTGSPALAVPPAQDLPVQNLPGEALLQCRGLGAQYKRIRVVFDVDLELRAGEVLAVLGPNGAGKSSLLGAIAGTVEGRGEARLGSLVLDGLPAHRRATMGLALVPEARRNLFPTLTVDENLSLGLRLAPPAERAAALAFILELFPILRERRDAAAGVLSGGEQQMLAIGVALGRRPGLLILDEPSQGLAPTIFDVLESAVLTLRRRGMAILMAEQNLAFAARIATRYVVLSHGRAVATGAGDELQDHGRLSSLYFGRAAD